MSQTSEMHIYQIKGLSHNLLNDEYNLAYSFSLPGTEKRVITLGFANKKDLDKYLESDKNSWFRMWLEHIINTTKELSTSADIAYKRSLELCESYYQSVYNGDVSIKELCARFIKGQKHFFKIIESFKGTQHITIINGLLTFCQQELR